VANKLKKDNIDVRCKQCYKIDRDKDDKNKDRALDYYEQNKEKCIKQKCDWNKTNKDKANATNRRCYEKKKAEKEEEIRKQSEEEAKNIISNITLIDKNDQPYAIICRESDGYINVTNLCKAGGRLFSTWRRKTTTEEFLKILEEDIKSEYQKDMLAQLCTDVLTNTEIYILELIKIETSGLNENRGTWVHPKVAINIAQWISPKFDVQVTIWVHQLLIVGSVKLTDDSSDKDIMDIQKDKIKYNRLKKEGNEDEANEVNYEINNKLLELEIKNKELENKLSVTLDAYNKQSKTLKRLQYNPEKVIYLLQHKEFKNMYKVGIANNLTSRMSTDFDVIYHEYTIYNDNDKEEIYRIFICK